jgi:hypothetical protein
MILGQPAPFVRAFVDAVDEAIRAQSPSHGMSAMQRTWLAFCVTAILVTNSICWARFERASLGTYSLAASSLMTRTTRVRNRPRRWAICTNCAIRKAGAISGDKVSSFSYW